MSEKRKPHIVIVAQKQGKKRNKLELFKSDLWPNKFKYPREKGRYRVRVNGVWWEGDSTFTLSEIMNLFRKQLAKNERRTKRSIEDVE